MPGPAPILVGQETPRFARLLLGIRQQRGWSRRELARRLGVDRGRLARWETTDEDPPAYLLPLLRDLLEVEGMQTTLEAQTTALAYLTIDVQAGRLSASEAAVIVAIMQSALIALQMAREGSKAA